MQRCMLAFVLVTYMLSCTPGHKCRDLGMQCKLRAKTAANMSWASGCSAVATCREVNRGGLQGLYRIFLEDSSPWFAAALRHISSKFGTQAMTRKL